MLPRASLVAWWSEALKSSFFVPTMERFTLVEALDFPAEHVVALGFSCDSVYLAVASSDGLVYVYKHRQRLLLWKFEGPSVATAIRWHIQEPYSIFVGGADGSCSLYRFNPQKPVCPICIHFGSDHGLTMCL